MPSGDLSDRINHFIEAHGYRLLHVGTETSHTLPVVGKGAGIGKQNFGEAMGAGIRRQSKDVDQACAALITDLKQRGMLDDTLVVWGGEFGRTIYCQGKLTRDNYGRDHHPRCFTVWMAGAGVKPGISYGATDDFGYNVASDGVHVHDLNATILHCLGVDHRRLTFKFQGLDMRLTGVEDHAPVQGILA